MAVTTEYNRIIFLKQHLFNTRFSVPTLPMYLLHEVLLPLKVVAHKYTAREGRSFYSAQMRIYTFFVYVNISLF